MVVFQVDREMFAIDELVFEFLVLSHRGVDILEYLEADFHAADFFVWGIGDLNFGKGVHHFVEFKGPHLLE